jgi:molybdopterin/thiamine biosynthesis adenylyltransferase
MPTSTSSFPAKAEEAIVAYTKDGRLPLYDARKIADTYGISLFEVEVRALENDIFPLRFIRNRHTLDAKEQLKLMHSHVVLVGCGGIGGFVAQLLAQSGVGRLSLYDPDLFEETNINRQNFCTLDTLGRPKAVVCEERLRRINPSLQLASYTEPFEKEKLGYHDAIDLLIEASDAPQSKRELSLACIERKIDFLHTALAGESFLLSLNRSLDTYYANSSKGAEAWTGNLASTAGAVAAVAGSQAVRILMGKETLLTEAMLMVDLATLESIPITP